MTRVYLDKCKLYLLFSVAAMPVPAHRSRGVGRRRPQQAMRVRVLPRDALHGALRTRAASQGTRTVCRTTESFALHLN